MNRYQKKYLGRLNTIERKFAKIYRAEIKRFNKEAFETSIISGKVKDYILKEHQENIFKILEENDTLTIDRFFTLTYNQFIKKVLVNQKKAMVNLSASKIAKKFILSNSLKQSKLIAETSKEKVQRAIAKGYELGEPVDKIAERIRDVDAVAFSRSFTIARTETHAASTYASSETIKAGQDAYGLVYNKSWGVNIDGRERPAHLAMATQPSIPMDAKFFVGGEYLDRPGDPNGSAENIIQCRCIEIYELQNNP